MTGDTVGDWMVTRYPDSAATVTSRKFMRGEPISLRRVDGLSVTAGWRSRRPRTWDLVGRIVLRNHERGQQRRARRIGGPVRDPHIAAFGTIVKSLVSDIFMPIIGYFFGGVDFSNLIVRE